MNIHKLATFDPVKFRRAAAPRWQKHNIKEQRAIALAVGVRPAYINEGLLGYLRGKGPAERIYRSLSERAAQILARELNMNWSEFEVVKKTAPEKQNPNMGRPRVSSTEREKDIAALRENLNHSEPNIREAARDILQRWGTA